jgi:hypothetical protein
MREDVEKAAGRHQVLVEIDHIRLVTGGQMHGKSRDQTLYREDERDPPRLETDQNGNAANELNENGNPNSHTPWAFRLQQNSVPSIQMCDALSRPAVVPGRMTAVTDQTS